MFAIQKKWYAVKRQLKRMSLKPPRLKFFYAWYYKHARVRENQILFESFHGKDLSDSPYYILKALMDSGEASKYRIYFASADPKAHQVTVDKLHLPVRLIDVTSYRYTKILATSRYLITNSSLPVYFIRRPEQVYLQTWHGTPLKTLGKKMRFGIESMYNIQHNFMQANYLLYPNEFTRDAMMEDYNLNPLFTGEVVISGYPRNSIFCDRKREEEVRRLLGNEGYTTFAYMPTWRGQSNHDIQTEEQDNEAAQMLAYLDSQLGDHQKLYVNFHPIVAGSIRLDSYRHIFPFPAEFDKYEFLNSTDALITDYSSVMFDYSVTRKPVILFMYDYDQYMYDRGMYLDVRELPFLKLYELEELKDCLVNETFRQLDYSGDKEYIRRFIPYDSLDAGEKLMRLVFHGDRAGLDMQSYACNREKEWSLFTPAQIKSNQALDGALRTVDPDKELVILEKGQFNPDRSAWLYDHYVDSCTFLFHTNTTPRTYLEEVRSKTPKIKDRLWERELLRVYPGLRITGERRREYYHGETGERFYLKEKSFANVQASVEDGDAVFSFPDLAGRLRKLMILDNYLILWSRPFTEAENRSGLVRARFSDALATGLFRKNRNYQLAVEIEDEQQQPKLCYLRDEAHVEQAQARKSSYDSLAARYGYLSPGEHLLRGMERPEKIFATLYDTSQGWIQIFVSFEDAILNKHLKASVKKIHTRGSWLNMTLELSLSNGEYWLEGVELRLRNTLRDKAYLLPYTTEEKEGLVEIRVHVNVRDYEMEPMYWDLNLLVSNGGETERIGCYTTGKQRKRFEIGNYVMDMGDGNILFPYRKRLAFQYRERTVMDGWGGRLKEFTALGIYTILHPYWVRKRTWLVYEKFCSVAQENGYYFFKYCMEQLPKEQNRHVYYILDKKSPDWDKMKVYGRQVVPFLSMRYMLYVLAANLYISPDSRKHIYVWRNRPNMITPFIERRRLFFLQHGVTALKRVHNIFGKTAPSHVTYFATTSTYEQDIITEYFGYSRGEAPILGFCRWDALTDRSDPADRIILVMPTWRLWLEENTSEEFVRSTYYRNYSGLLTDPRLLAALKENHTRLIFYIHPKLRDHLQDFKADESIIELIPFGEQPLNEIIMKCSMLITDYSSVCWDAYYLEKPVLFYHFDREDYITAHGGSYLDFSTELFGDSFETGDALVDGIIACMEDGFREKEAYAAMRPRYFAYRDDNNCKRTYDFIVSKGF